MVDDIFTKFKMPGKYLDDDSFSAITRRIALKQAVKINKELEQQLLEIIADIDIEFAAGLDDWLSGKENAEDINLDRLEVTREQEMFSNYPLNILYLDGQPIAEYKLVGSLGENRSVLRYQVNRL